MNSKIVLAVLMVIVAVFVSAFPFVDNLKCPVCVDKGYKSTVNEGASTTTCLAVVPYYDENGKYHYNNPNITTTSYCCSSGHTFTAAYGPKTNIFTVTSSNDSVFMWVPYTNYISDFLYCTNSISSAYAFTMTNSLARSVSIYGVDFDLRDGTLVVNMHDIPMNEAASNLLEFVVERFKENGYKLTKE